MRLEKYINESFNIEDYIPILKKECKPYLKECREINAFLCRASNSSYDIKKIKPRIDRKPRDTPLELHNYLDFLFNKKFGWKVRSEGVFTSGDYILISEYASYEYLFFPINKFKFVWSPEVSDIFMAFREHEITDFSNKMIGNLDDHKDILKSIINEYKNDNLYSAISSGNEVMVKCKEYYMINMRYINILKEELL